MTRLSYHHASCGDGTLSTAPEAERRMTSEYVTTAEYRQGQQHTLDRMATLENNLDHVYTVVSNLNIRVTIIESRLVSIDANLHSRQQQMRIQDHKLDLLLQYFSIIVPVVPIE